MMHRAISLCLIAPMCAMVACSDGGSSVTVTGGPPDSAAETRSGDAADGDSADSGLPAIVGCDAGATGAGCGYLDVTLTGGITASDCCYGCGADTDSFSWGIDQNRVSFQITFAHGQAPLERVGTFPLDSVSLDEGYGDGGIIGWQTPPGACTVTVTRSVCVAVQSVAQNWDWITGSGHCTQPAAPTPAKGPATPVTIGDFMFRGYVFFP